MENMGMDIDEHKDTGKGKVWTAGNLWRRAAIQWHASPLSRLWQVCMPPANRTRRQDFSNQARFLQKKYFIVLKEGLASLSNEGSGITDIKTPGSGAGAFPVAVRPSDLLRLPALPSQAARRQL
jgi:hypothetical protein